MTFLRGASSSLRGRIGCLWPILGLGLGIGASVTVLGLGGFLRQPRLAGIPLAPIVVRIPAPTAAPSPTDPPDLPPTPTPPPARLEGTILVGDLVEVHGTGGDGVRVRSEPNLQAVVVGLGQDGEVYQVLGGPLDGGGYLWWEIVRLDDSTRRGWAVSTYLRLLQ